MPRKPRTYLKTSFFHVITQGINKSYIFDKEEDIKYRKKIKKTSGIILTSEKNSGIIKIQEENSKNFLYYN